MSFDDSLHASFAPDSPPDIEVRRRALNPAESFAVSAPAGSGKTGLLTQRILTLLNYCDEPEEVLAITFTRKAAGEMQERLLNALWQAAEQPEPENPHARLTWQLAQNVLQRDREREWSLLQSPQRLRVQTIDSLCRSITQQLPLSSGLGAQPETLDDPSKAYQLAVRELFILMEKSTLLRDDMARLLRHLDNNIVGVEKLLLSLLAKREQWLGVLLQARGDDARKYLEAILQQVICEHLTQLQRCLILHQSELCILADQAAQNLAQESEQKNRIHTLLGITNLPSCTPDAVEQWLAIADLLLTNTGTYRARLTKNEGFPAGKPGTALKEKFSIFLAELQQAQPECAQLLHGVRELPAPVYEDNQWLLLNSLTRLLPILAAQLTVVFKQLGATDYSAISQAALLALGDDDAPSDIALQLDYRIRHILVDEFQDTASPQLQLLEKLTQGWQTGDGRTLFIVGDGMQSCYGFRNANVGLFLDARERGIGSIELTPLDLTVNFRSQANVVKWVNNIFCQAFPAQDDIGRGAVKYSHSIAFNQPLSSAPVEFFGCLYRTDAESDTSTDTENNNEKMDAQIREAQTVVTLVQNALTQHPDDNIAILVRNRSHLSHILPALSGAGLSWQATDIDRLDSRMAIIDLMSLTRALLNPNDRTAWLAILRAPWCGLDLHDLFHITNFNLIEISARVREQDYPVIWQQLLHFQQLPELSDAGRHCLTRMMRVLQPVMRQRRRKPLRQWIEGVWLALGGPATLVDQNDLENLDSYFALLEKYQEGGSIRDWQAFTLATEKLFAAPKADADSRVQVMTIHKAKGLEFDRVIIPGLDRNPRKDDHELVLWQERLNAEGERQLLLGPLAATGEDHNQLYNFMRREKEKQQDYEATRLLYVGCTRAIKHLYLLASVKVKQENLIAPGKSSLLARIWEQAREQMQPASASASASAKQLSATDLQTQLNFELTAGPEQKPGLQHILRLTPEWRLPRLAEVNVLQLYRGHEYDDEENLPEPETRNNRLARHTGTILHRALDALVEQQLAHEFSDAKLQQFLNAQQTFWQIQLRQFGWQGQELQQSLAKIARAVQQTLQDPKGRWLLNHTHTQSACEFSLLHPVANGIQQSIIDRTFIADGVRWIVDYKSSEPVTGQSIENFLQIEIDSYRDQLYRYRDSFSALEKNIIRTALYFPLLNDTKWIEID